MRKELDVLHVIESPDSSAALVGLLLVLGLIGVDAFQNAKPSKKTNHFPFLLGQL